MTLLNVCIVKCDVIDVHSCLNSDSNSLTCALEFLIIYVTWFWLYHDGKPYRIFEAINLLRQILARVIKILKELDKKIKNSVNYL